MRIMAGEGFALREEWPQLWGKSRGLCRWLCSGGQAQRRSTTVSRISNLYPGLRASSLRKPTQVRSRLASRVHGPRRSGCRSGRARRLLRSHTPSARATADRHGSRRPIDYCRIAHRTSSHVNLHEHGAFCERKEISRFGKVLSGTDRKATRRFKTGHWHKPGSRSKIARKSRGLP